MFWILIRIGTTNDVQSVISLSITKKRKNAARSSQLRSLWKGVPDSLNIVWHWTSFFVRSVFVCSVCRLTFTLLTQTPYGPVRTRMMQINGNRYKICFSWNAFSCLKLSLVSFEIYSGEIEKLMTLNPSETSVCTEWICEIWSWYFSLKHKHKILSLRYLFIENQFGFCDVFVLSKFLSFNRCKHQN